MKQDGRRPAKLAPVLLALVVLPPLVARDDPSGDDQESERPPGLPPSVFAPEPFGPEGLSREEPGQGAQDAARANETTPSPPRSADTSGRGLLDFRDPYPLAKFHLQLPTATPPGLEEGETSGLVQFDWANTSADAANFLVDAETYTIRLGLWHALRRNLYLGVETAVEGRDGGILDAFIDDFHQAMRISVAERDDRPRDAYDIIVVDSGGSTELDRGFGLGNTALRAHWIFMEGGDDDWWPTLALQPQLYLPTSTRGFGARGADLGVALSAQKNVFDHVYLYAIGGFTYLTDPTTEGLRYEEFNYQVTTGFEVFLWWDSVSFVGQFTYYSGLLKNVARLGRERNYVGGAIKHRIHPRVDVIWGFMENLPPLKITTDATFSMGCEFRF